MKNPKAAKAFGVHLRQLREGEDLSQQELADLSDVAKKTIQRIENGLSSPTHDVMVSIARGLGKSVKDLVDFPLPSEKKK